METLDAYNVTSKFGYEHTVAFLGTAGATAANYGTFWNITHPIEILAVHTSWSTASTSGTLQIERLTDTEAPGSGSALFNTALSLAGTANTVHVKKGIDLTGERRLRGGDRLAFVDAGTLTNLVNLVVTLYWVPLGRGGYIT